MTGRHPDLAGQGVLVTGGGSGIGAALVAGFAAQGARVAFLDIAEAESRALTRDLDGTVAHRPHYIKADLRDIDALRAAVAEAAGALGGLRVLVNNAARDDRHALEAVERGKPRGRLGLEIGEDIVLDDDGVVRGGRIQQPVRHLR